MFISYNWLREIANIPMEPAELAERLTGVGLPVDAMDAVGNDYILDVEVASNRPDCLSHIGIAREASVITNAELSLPNAPIGRTGVLTRDLTSVEINDPDLCPRYAARIVQGVRIGPSPAWLKSRLEALGQRSINNVADITNYVLLEQGQPLHAFDLDRLKEHRIVVRRALEGEKFRTLDGIERKLDSEMLVIADASTAVATAGVMGGEESEISEATSDVLIESAYFDPASIRRTAQILNMQTEASRRFERGADFHSVIRAQDRCVSLICEIAGGKASEEPLDVIARQPSEIWVSIRAHRVKALTGVETSVTDVRRILSALGFVEKEARPKVEEEPSFRDGILEGGPAHEMGRLVFQVPSWRIDVTAEEDLVEEVLRHGGFDRIGASLPPVESAGEYQAGERRKQAARHALASMGFDEAINWSFIDESHDAEFETVPGVSEPYVTLTNPIVEGAKRMRPTAIPGLLESIRGNLRHGSRNVKLFEIGRVFGSSVKEDLPREVEVFALALTGQYTEQGRAGGERELDFYDLKGAIELAADAMRVAPAVEFEPAEIRHLRVGQSATISHDGQVIGSAGRLSDEIAGQYKLRQPVYVAEFNLEQVFGVEEVRAGYTPLPKMPSIERDASFFVSRNTTYAEISRAIAQAETQELRDIKLLDVYEGASIAPDKRSLTLRFEYRADDRTLKDEEVDELHSRVVRLLEKNFNVQMRI